MSKSVFDVDFSDEDEFEQEPASLRSRGATDDGSGTRDSVISFPKIGAEAAPALKPRKKSEVATPEVATATIRHATPGRPVSGSGARGDLAVDEFGRVRLQVTLSERVKADVTAYVAGLNMSMTSFGLRWLPQFIEVAKEEASGGRLPARLFERTSSPTNKWTETISFTFPNGWLSDLDSIVETHGVVSRTRLLRWGLVKHLSSFEIEAVTEDF